MQTDWHWRALVKEIQELSRSIENMKIEKRKLEKKVEHYKRLLSSFMKNQEVYRKKVNLEKSNLRIQVKRLEAELHQMKSQKFEVNLNNTGDVAQIRPLGCSARFKSYVHIPRHSATASSPSRRSLQYRTIVLWKCSNLLSGHSVANQARQIISFLRSDINILAKVKQELAISFSD
uniref:Uncharacterized protein n=1 Tax=Romanomermis culicivorax TaxID=13658 RepID=A0A915IY47_ROMCU